MAYLHSFAEELAKDVPPADHAGGLADDLVYLARVYLLGGRVLLPRRRPSVVQRCRRVVRNVGELRTSVKAWKWAARMHTFR